MSEEIVHEPPARGVDPAPEHPCERCEKTAEYRITYRARKKKHELYLCKEHHNQFQNVTHPYAHSIKKLNP